MKSKVLLIIGREYLTRVKKKSFIIMTILAPLLFAGIAMAPILINKADNTLNKISVVDENGIFFEKFENSANIEFVRESDTAIAIQALRDAKDGNNYLLYITKGEDGNPHTAILYFIENEPGLIVKERIDKSIQDIFHNKLLIEKFNITAEDYAKVKDLKVTVNVQNLETGEESNTGIKTGIGYVCAFLIYMFVFMFGSQVMSGVIEEKSSRIVEVIVSSVKPFQLMVGKIIGIAFVGLTQFALWVVLTVGLVVVGAGIFDSSEMKNTSEISAVTQMLPENATGDIDVASITEQLSGGNSEVASLISGILDINWWLIIGVFLIYWIGGYLVYASLFAAVGSAVENEADTNQFMLPLTIPLILALVVMASVMQNPNGSIAFWFSMIPFTSPVVMLMRVPFGVPTWQLCLSITLLVATFIGTTWIAAKIYRVGILMYGKKTTWKELGKWLFYKG